MTILFRTLLANPALEEWQLDPSIFTLIFLSLIVKKGGVIFDIPNCHKRPDGIFKTVDSVLAVCSSRERYDLVLMDRRVNRSLVWKVGISIWTRNCLLVKCNDMFNSHKGGWRRLDNQDDQGENHKEMEMGTRTRELHLPDGQDFISFPDLYTNKMVQPHVIILLRLKWV
jgi:hypothetical protein